MNLSKRFPPLNVLSLIAFAMIISGSPVAFGQHQRGGDVPNWGEILERGQRLWKEGDSLKALNFWEQAVFSVGDSWHPSQPEPFLKLVMALIDGYRKFRQPEKAYDALSQGFRIEAQSRDLQIAELTLYAEFPEFYSGIQEKYEAYLLTWPDDTDMRMTFAAYLEKLNLSGRAASEYEAILSLDSAHYEANLRLAAFHVNHAVEYQLRQEVAGDETVVNWLEERIIQHLRQSVAPLEFLHKSETDNPEWILQLATVHQYLGNKEAKKYIRLMKQNEKKR